MEKNPKQLEIVQASLMAHIEPRVEMGFLVSKLVGGLWTSWTQALVPTLIGEGEIGLTNMSVIVGI